MRLDRTWLSCLAGTILVVPTLASSAVYTVSASSSAGDAYLPTVRDSKQLVEQREGVLTSALFSALGNEAQAHAESYYGILRCGATGVVNPAAGRVASADAKAAFTDTITVAGTPETPVQVRFSYFVHGSIDSRRTWYQDSTDAWGNGKFKVTSTAGAFVNGDTDFDGHSFVSGTIGYQWTLSLPATDIITATLNTKGGDVIFIEGSLEAHVLSSQRGAPSNYPVFTASADFSHTAGMLVDVLTPGQSFSAASGSTYAQVPEPSMAGLIMAALTLFGRPLRHNAAA